MTDVLVMCWNIEKVGRSSRQEKEKRVSAFLDMSVAAGAGIIFLCEVHSARVDDIVNHCRVAYGDATDVSSGYFVASLPGGHSNAYVYLIHRDLTCEGSHEKLRGLNREMLVINVENGPWLLFGHFKSGRTGLTKDQLQQAATVLEEIVPGNWAIMGDMNWDIRDAGALAVPPSTPISGWADMTQAKGGILDWCLAGSGTTVTAVDGPSNFPAELTGMVDPDHRPVGYIFTI